MFILLNIFISLITGFISGILSGFIVTKKYRKMDRKEIAEKTYYNGLYNYYEYIRSIKIELDWLITNSTKDYKELHKLINNYGRVFENVDLIKEIPEETSELLCKIYNTLNELGMALDNNGCNNYHLHRFRAELFKHSLGLLKLTNRKYAN